MITTTDNVHFYANFETELECELIHLVMEAYEKGRSEKNRIAGLVAIETGDCYIEFKGTTDGKALLDELKKLIYNHLEQHDEAIKEATLTMYRMQNDME